MKALEGIRVLDLTRLLPGAIVTRWFSDFGAEVIKLEQPPLGDYARYTFDGTETNPIFEFTNRGKKSVLIDLKDPAGKEAFLRLARSADVLLEGFRPGVMDRLGLGYASLEAENPRLIYASLTGYGSEGKYAQLAGHDINYLALSGVLDVIGAKDGPPVVPGVQIADLAGGSQPAIIGILLALEVRHRTGRGQRVEASMFASSTGLMAIPQSTFEATGKAPQRGGDLLSGGFACYRVYAAAAGSYVAVGALEPRFWGNLCRELGCEHLTGQQFAPDQSPVIAALSAKFMAATAEQWFERLGGKDCCITPVRNLKDAIADYPDSPQPLLSHTPGSAGKPAPGLGEHNSEFI
ncbi:MAG TPA: CoA transferase [Bryobacteraceae bacterium]|jgi:crotonobetainyl-CoA:carnitine CoA-transferase CaiB-like acyl-CoA transferase|nr:CoA transferase [Bryobacteraceae bacterium]